MDLEQLLDYIKTYASKGYPLESIVEGLRKNRIPEDVIQEALKKYTSTVLPQNPSLRKPLKTKKRNKKKIFILSLVFLLFYLGFGAYRITKLTYFQSYSEHFLLGNYLFLWYEFNIKFTTIDAEYVPYNRDKDLPPNSSPGALFPKIQEGKSEKIYPFFFTYSEGAVIAALYLLDNPLKATSGKLLSTVFATVSKEKGLISEIGPTRTYEESIESAKRVNWKNVFKRVDFYIQKYPNIKYLKLAPPSSKNYFNDVDNVLFLKINDSEEVLIDEMGNDLSKERALQYDKRLELLIKDKDDTIIENAEIPDFYIKSFEVEEDEPWGSKPKITICTTKQYDKPIDWGVRSISSWEGVESVADSFGKTDGAIGPNNCSILSPSLIIGDSNTETYQVIINPLFEIEESSYKNNVDSFSVNCAVKPCVVSSIVKPSVELIAEENDISKEVSVKCDENECAPKGVRRKSAKAAQ